MYSGVKQGVNYVAVKLKIRLPKIKKESVFMGHQVEGFSPV